MQSICKIDQNDIQLKVIPLFFHNKICIISERGEEHY